MKRIWILLALGLVGLVAFTGCEKEADATVVCSGCNMEIDKAMATESDGVWMCSACVVKAKAEETVKEALVDCAGGCGMQMVKADAQLIDGKYYCAGCATHVGHEHADQPDAGTEEH